MKWICEVCGYVHEGDQPPEKCPVCQAPASKFKKQDDGDMAWAAEHVVGIAKDVDPKIIEAVDYFRLSIASSNLIFEGMKSIFFTNSNAFRAPYSRSMPESSHSTESGP